MAAKSSNGYSITILTCEGHLSDPAFKGRFARLLGKLNSLLGKVVKVHKLEPWNSVRVTLSIPQEAALRLKQLANEGSAQLRALGILSVQVDGDQAISLRIATGNAEPQEIVLRTVQDGPSTSGTSQTETVGLSRILSGGNAIQQICTNNNNKNNKNNNNNNASDTSERVQFKSPNVVCPPDSVVPKVPVSSACANTTTPPSTKQPYSRPFPFASMNQAIHSSTRESFSGPPPPYPGKHPPTAVNISSPLLVNLLQNDGAPQKKTNSLVVENVVKQQTTGLLPSTIAAPLTRTMQSINNTFIHNNNNTALSSTSASSTTVASSQIINGPTTINKLVTNRTLPPNTFVQQPLQQQQQQQQQKGQNIIMPRLNNSNNNNIINNNNNNLEPEITLNNSKIHHHQHQIQQQCSIFNSAQASTSSPSALLNTSIRQNSNKLINNSNHIINNSTISNYGNPLQINNNTQILTQNIITTQLMVAPQSQQQQQPPPPPLQTRVVTPTAIQVNNVQAHHLAATTTTHKLLPPPPPYSVAINRTWENSSTITTPQSATSLLSSPPQSSLSLNPFLDLTPSLTDLKPDDLEDLLPTLERDLARSPPEIPEELTIARTTMLTNLNDKRNFLINPLTGELEPQSSDDDSDLDNISDVFTGLPSPANISDDDTTNSSIIIRPDTTTDQSDSETKSSSHSDCGNTKRNKNNKVVRNSNINNNNNNNERNNNGGGRGDTSSPNLNKPMILSTTTNTSTGTSASAATTEKIKLRLKLEKSEPINSAYKVDVSFIQQQQQQQLKRVTTSVMNNTNEELRVPPLHISLRGRNHAFITNKKKSKLNLDGSSSKTKIRNKTQSQQQETNSGKMRKVGDVSNNNNSNSAIIDDNGDNKSDMESKKVKKFKINHEKDHVLSNLLQDSNISINKVSISTSSTATIATTLTTTTTICNNEKQKERRGSDSELAKANLKFIDSNGLISIDKKRRLSQTDINNEMIDHTTQILGSTNIGTIANIPQKLRKEKNKLKDLYKNNKEIVRNKNFNNKLQEKYCIKQQQQQQVVLPTAGEIDMEAKFKQRLLEGSEKGIHRPPHRTETIVHQVITDSNLIENADKVAIAEFEPPPIKEKSPEPDKYNTPERNKQVDNLITDNKSGRSPNSGAQGEDSGIESMDALSEKSPNQASQSPHADIIISDPTTITSSVVVTTTITATTTANNNIKSKTQVPDILDIEAQLAKMEGLNGVGDEDDLVNDNNKNNNIKQQNLVVGQCCELTSALQDSLKQGAVTLSVSNTTSTTNNNASIPSTTILNKEQQAEVSLVPIKMQKDDLEPLPVRVSPPLYTYSNSEKGIHESESPSLSDDEDNDDGDDDEDEEDEEEEDDNDDDEEENTVITTSTIPTITATPPSSVVTTTINKSKSLLEQLLIEIPDNNQTSSLQSPATRSVRTRALSKLNSPELNQSLSLINKQTRLATIPTTITPVTTITSSTISLTSITTTNATIKRKRHESDSSNNSLEDVKNKKTRKCSENLTSNVLKSSCIGIGNVDSMKLNHVNKKTIKQPHHQQQQDESSDSDEPLIEKVRKTNSVTKNKIKSGNTNNKSAPISTRRSVRAMTTTIPSPNTRSKGDNKIIHSETEAIRRKTRSAVSEGESKRKKEIK